jgi:transcription antitermination factor NusG
MEVGIVEARGTVTDSPAPRAAGGVRALRWHVLHTKSRQEKALAEQLGSAGIDCFLPLSREVRYYGRRKFAVELPLFPGYVFLRGTVEHWYFAERSGRVARVIPVTDQAGLDRDLASLRLALDRGAPLTAADWFGAGVRVEVSAGPFKGVVGTVDSFLKDDRLALQVNMLGRAAQLEIDRSLLRRLD